MSGNIIQSPKRAGREAGSKNNVKRTITNIITKYFIFDSKTEKNETDTHHTTNIPQRQPRSVTLVLLWLLWWLLWWCQGTEVINFYAFTRN